MMEAMPGVSRKKVDQTAQNVRFKGEFDTNLVFSLGGTVRYTF